MKRHPTNRIEADSSTEMYDVEDDVKRHPTNCIEADRSTEMYDVKDGVHLAAAKRLAGSSFKNLALFHYHSSLHVKRHPTN